MSFDASMIVSSIHYVSIILVPSPIDMINSVLWRLLISVFCIVKIAHFGLLLKSFHTTQN